MTDASPSPDSITRPTGLGAAIDQKADRKADKRAEKKTDKVADRGVIAGRPPSTSAVSDDAELVDDETPQAMTGPGLLTRLPSAPAWMRSIRFRMTLLYSIMFFGLASMALGGMYWRLSASFATTEALQLSPGAVVFDPDLWQETELNSLDVLVRQRALSTLQQYSYTALVLLFFVSLPVGWFVAGRVLQPIERITNVARNIQATDLSRRINLPGPDDELKRLSDTFDNMLLRLDHAFAGQRRLIHEASHELRNPLAVMRTNLDVTTSDPGATFEDYKHTAEVMSRSTDRMIHLVDDLLVYARQETDRGADEPVDVSRLVLDVGEEFFGAASKVGLALKTAATPGLWVMGNSDSLHQAMSNLLTNAFRYATDGTIVRVAAGQEQGWVWMAVEDDGPGISKSDAERVFERGERGGGADGAVSRKGSGLGLTIVRQIAEAHKGEARLLSEPGKGSTFAIWLPALVTSDPGLDTIQLKLGTTPAPDAAASGRARPNDQAADADLKSAR